MYTFIFLAANFFIFNSKKFSTLFFNVDDFFYNTNFSTFLLIVSSTHHDPARVFNNT